MRAPIRSSNTSRSQALGKCRQLILLLLVTSACSSPDGTKEMSLTAAGAGGASTSVAGSGVAGAAPVNVGPAPAAGSGITAAGAPAITPPPRAGAPAAGSGGAGRSANAAGAPAAGRGGAADSAGGAGAPAAAGAPAGMPSGFEPCPAADVCKILPLGDSITFGIGYAGGYRVELFRRAQADGKKITFTGSLSNGPNMVGSATFPKKNEGHSGWKIDQLLPLIPMPALQEVPHIVLLMIGTNDISQNSDLPNAPKRLGNLIDKLVMNAPNALIVIATITPLGGSGAVQTYNAAIPAIVEARATAGKHVILVDQFKGFPTSELGDGVHPNQKGYERMAQVWYEAIGKYLH